MEKVYRCYYDVSISPATKMVSIFVGIAAIAVMMTISARGEALADPQHCDESGSLSCYSIGYSDGRANPGTSCPSGHSSCWSRGLGQQ
ncbi:MAG: hypothetical protein WCF23_06665 [Candidatus Nitrosopolaris sp.]